MLKVLFIQSKGISLSFPLLSLLSYIHYHGILLQELDGKSTGDKAREKEEVATSPIELEHNPIILDPIDSAVEATLPVEFTKASINTTV